MSLKLVRRMLFVPALIVLIGAALIYTGILPITTALPISQILMVAGVTTAMLVLWEGVATVQAWQMPEPEEPPRYEGVIVPKDVQNVAEDMAETVVQKAERAVEEAENFTSRTANKVKIRIDMSEPEPEDKDE